MRKSSTFRRTKKQLNSLKLVELVKFKECSVKVYNKRTYQRTFNIRPKNSFYLEGTKMMNVLWINKKLYKNFLTVFLVFSIDELCYDASGQQITWIAYG